MKQQDKQDSRDAPIAVGDLVLDARGAAYLRGCVGLVLTVNRTLAYGAAAEVFWSSIGEIVTFPQARLRRMSQ